MITSAEAQPPIPHPDLLGEYRPAPRAYDELTGPDGLPRAHWRRFVGTLHQLGPQELKARMEDARRMMSEQGVTYNVYADDQGVDRPWEFDVIPFFLPAGEWQAIERGLVQRGRLLNEILADVYGSQRLLKGDLLPPALIYANPAFLRCCHGIAVPERCFLALHAVDLARSPDGRWWVLADRTQAPSGAGYALENRIALSRVLPDVYQAAQVQRLAPFFQTFRRQLHQLAPRNRDNPRVVLLTPGPYNETYFEQAFLARYLGFTLVEGGDLTVRDRQVFVKTLEGLQPVDVIVRRVDDTFCDPLELRSDSFLGVPGLVEAVRGGNVAVANALGSGLVETPSLAAFLPGLCQHMLGETLEIPSVATWWCGQPDELHYVLDHLDQVVVKRAFRSTFAEPVFGEHLNPTKRAALRDKITAAPVEFAGQEQVELSNAPVVSENQIVPRPLVLRAYIARAGDSYVVLPGGLTRVSGSEHDPVVSMQSGGASKDTWVLAEAPVQPVSLLPGSAEVVHLERSAAEVPSRVAENLFWLGRYAERLEHTSRLLRCYIRYLLGEADIEDTAELEAMTDMLVGMGFLPDSIEADSSFEAREREVLTRVYRIQQVGSVRELLARLKSIAAALRDRFSLDSWRILTQLQADALPRSGRTRLAGAQSYLDSLVVDLAALSGMAMENMTRGHSWRFLDIGRRLERAVNVVALARAPLQSYPSARSALQPLLISSDSLMTYRRRYFGQTQLQTVLHLLLLDETNPRSLRFQLDSLAVHAASLPTSADEKTNREVLLLSAAVERLHALDVLALSSPLQRAEARVTARSLEKIVAGVRGFSEKLTRRFFSHATTRVS